MSINTNFNTEQPDLQPLENQQNSELPKSVLNQIDLSRILQRRLERSLAGFAILYPLAGLKKYHELRDIFLDDMSTRWFEILNKHQAEISLLSATAAIEITTRLAAAFDNGRHFSELTYWMNRLFEDYSPVSVGRGELIWSGYSTQYICDDICNQIQEQDEMRPGLQELAVFANRYLAEVTHV